MMERTSTEITVANKDKLLLSWLSTLDHKRLGMLYLLSALLFFLLAGAAAVLMRTQLITAQNQFLDAETYNEFFTMHGTTMIFFVLMPAFIGLTVYLVPIMIGANEMAFPRLNAFSFWISFFGGVLLYFSFMAGGAPNAGWFNYAPLNERHFSAGPGIDYYCIALILSGIGNIAAGINTITTIVTMRAEGMKLNMLPMFVWMTLINSFLIIGALPSLNAALAMLLMDRQLDAHFFNTMNHGSATLWQHLFWFFGHPEVYILILPAFGIFSEVFPVFSRKKLFGYNFIAASTVAIALLSFGVWVHHMFATGLGNTINGFFSAASLLIGVPTGVKIFNWIGTMYQGSIRLKVSMLFAVAFLIEFTIGGLSGIMFSLVPIDWSVTDSYMVVAHLHYVFIGGSLFGIFAGLFYWFPKMTGKMLDERWGKAFFWLFVVGFNLTFLIQHFLGFMGMPRRVYTFPALPGFTWMNATATVGAYLMAGAVFILLITIYKSLKHGVAAPADPWNAWTLEWYTAAPPPEKNFTALPFIRSRRPLYDLKNPDKPDWLKEDFHKDAPYTKQVIAQPLLLMRLLIGSEVILFLSLILATIYFMRSSGFIEEARQQLHPDTTIVFTAILILSSATLMLAEKYREKAAFSKQRLWLAVTMLLGLVFIGGQAWEYVQLLQKGIWVDNTELGSSFYTLTGFHALHVVVGLIALMAILVLSKKPDFLLKNSSIYKAVALYWHFVDLVWIAVFLVVYIVPRYIG